MRFIKKANLEQINELSSDFKEFELFLKRDDIGKIKDDLFVKKLEDILDKNEAIITAVHLPLSKYITDSDTDKSTNSISFCEIISDKDELELFSNVCKFSDNIGMKFHMILTLIIHAGCVLGCNTDLQGFECPYNVDVSDCPFRQKSTSVNNNINVRLAVNEFIGVVKECKFINVAIENITPYISKNNQTDYQNCGYDFENINIAEFCNRLLVDSTQEGISESKNQFGTVLDFCHVIATHDLLKNSNSKEKLISEYIKENKNLIKLLHFSNYDSSTQKHGVSFEDNLTLLNFIKQKCIENFRKFPITLEVDGGADTQTSILNFRSIMLQWNKMHELFNRNLINTDTYKDFFDKLYNIFSVDIDNVKISDLQKLKEVIVKKSANKKNGQFLFGFDNSKQQKYNLNAFQLQAYEYYMRYCMLVFDLQKVYQENFQQCKDAIDYYIFVNNYDEIKFEGLAYYYNIIWNQIDGKKLYHCEDGCIGMQSTKTNISFTDILIACFDHITTWGNTGWGSNFYSTGKNFGRCMLKYFGTNGSSYPQTIEIFNTNINWVSDTNRPYTIQQFLNSDFCNRCDNFSVDFSAFLNGRGTKADDKNPESITGLAGKIGYVLNSIESIGSIYDGEVIFKKVPCNPIIKANLLEDEYLILMYAYIAQLKKISLISVNQQYFNNVYNNEFRQFLNNFNNEWNTQLTLKNQVIRFSVINNILQNIDWENERKNRPDRREGAGENPSAPNYIGQYMIAIKRFLRNSL